MTFKELKESVEDRVAVLQNTAHGNSHHYYSGELHGRLEEAKVILDLINRVDAAEQERKEHPLLYVSADEIDEAEPGVERHDPSRC